MILPRNSKSTNVTSHALISVLGGWRGESLGIQKQPVLYNILSKKKRGKTKKSKPALDTFAMCR